MITAGEQLLTGWRQFTDYAAPWEPIPDDGLERHPESRSPPAFN